MNPSEVAQKQHVMPLFPLFQSHLDLAHRYWKEVLEQGGWAIDATCGNGKDTLFLVQNAEGVIALDLQEQALQRTQQRAIGAEKGAENLHLFHQSHATFPPLAHTKPIRLIVYNLGYLPGGDKTVTTLTETTLQSIQKGLDLLIAGGVMSITCYPGHAEGAKEESALEEWLPLLPSHTWNVCFHRWKNRPQSPSLFLIQKKII